MYDTLRKDGRYLANTYRRFPIALSHGEGSIVYDEAGRIYIDLTAGIGVNVFGAADRQWIEAVEHQLHKIAHTSNLYANRPAAELAALLCEKTGMGKVFFSNSGAEANECAIKAARKYAKIRKGDAEYCIISLTGSFHGRTLTTLSATGQKAFHSPYTPLTPGFLYTEPEDMQMIEQLLQEHPVAGILIECIQGEGGVRVLDEAYLRQLQTIARREDILLIVDEVQTGNGRTGALYSYMHFGLEPDLVTTAKGLGGGLPIGATLLSKRLCDVFSPGDHGSTFGGNPVCCSGALSILNRLDDTLFASVREKGNFIQRQLVGGQGIRSVTGLGLMVGVETVKDPRHVALECLKKGVLCLTAKEKLRLLPPLNISWEHLSAGIEMIKDVCSQ